MIGITRNDQATYKFCVTWSEQSRISYDTGFLFDEDETIYIRLPPQMTRKADDAKKLATQFTPFYAFIVHTAFAGGEDGTNDSVCKDIPLVSLVIIDTAPNDVVLIVISKQLKTEESSPLLPLTTD